MESAKKYREPRDKRELINILEKAKENQTVMMLLQENKDGKVTLAQYVHVEQVHLDQKIIQLKFKGKEQALFSRRADVLLCSSNMEFIAWAKIKTMPAGLAYIHFPHKVRFQEVRYSARYNFENMGRVLVEHGGACTEFVAYDISESGCAFLVPTAKKENFFQGSEIIIHSFLEHQFCEPIPAIVMRAGIRRSRGIQVGCQFDNDIKSEIHEDILTIIRNNTMYLKST